LINNGDWKAIAQFLNQHIPALEDTPIKPYALLF